MGRSPVRSRVRAWRLLLVCLVLAFTSAPPRFVAGWFESVVAIASADGKSEPPASPDRPAISTNASRPSPERAPRSIDPLARLRAFDLAIAAAAARPNTPSFDSPSRLHLRNGVFLC